MRTPALPRLPRLARRMSAVIALASLALLALTGAWRRYRSGAGEPSVHFADRWHEGNLILDRRGATLRRGGGPQIGRCTDSAPPRTPKPWPRPS